MSQKHFTPTPEKRGLLERLSLVGWIIVITVSALVILLAVATVNWATPRMQDLPLLGRATPTSVLPTSTPRPTATPLPTATATPTSTVNYPATWSAGMWQDANGMWWPADDVREDVIGMVNQHYLEIYENIWNRPRDEVYETLTDEDLDRYLTDQHLEDYLLTRQEYRTTGNFHGKRQIVTDRKLTVRDFAPDGLTCNVADMIQDTHLLQYNAETGDWDKVEIPDDGLLNGTQYLGTVIYRMKYDPEDGRWKQSELVEWLPRP